jgi:hypothetical protein
MPRRTATSTRSAGDVFCVRLPQRRLNETEVHELADDRSV